MIRASKQESSNKPLEVAERSWNFGDDDDDDDENLSDRLEFIDNRSAKQDYQPDPRDKSAHFRRLAAAKSARNLLSPSSASPSQHLGGSQADLTSGYGTTPLGGASSTTGQVPDRPGSWWRLINSAGSSSAAPFGSRWRQTKPSLSQYELIQPTGDLFGESSFNRARSGAIGNSFDNLEQQTVYNNQADSSATASRWRRKRWHSTSLANPRNQLSAATSNSSVFALYALRYAYDKFQLSLRAFRQWYHDNLTYHKLSNRMEYDRRRFERWYKSKGRPLSLRALDHYDQVVIWIAGELFCF